METQKMTDLELGDCIDSALAKADGIARLFFHASNNQHEHILLEDLGGATWALNDLLNDANKANDELCNRRTQRL